jgi:hypothetical protein
MSKTVRDEFLTPLAAGLLAWLIPGAGHLYLRRTARGIILFVCINGLFWSGVAMGGVFTVDPPREKWWFTAQMCTGLSGVGAWYRQNVQRHHIAEKYNLPLAPPPDVVVDKGNRIDNTAKVNDWQQSWLNAEHEEGGIDLVYPAEITSRAYSGVAGMLNVLCIFDAIMLGLMGKFGEPASVLPSKEALPANGGAP